MNPHTYNLTIKATSKEEANSKANSLAQLAGQFDAKTLAALAKNGKKFLSSPAYGGLIRKNLGIR